MNPNKTHSAGFSFIETMVVVAAVGVMAAIAVPVISELKQTAKESKLSSEVTSLNSAVKKFVASGGEITEDDTILEVLDLLKQQVSDEDAITHVGFGGSLVDPRLTGEVIDENTPGKRVVWNFAGRRFEVTEDNVVGIRQFELDENAEKVETNRKVATPFKYSPEEGWVWEYGVPGNKLVFAPTDVTTSPDSDDPVDPILISLVPPTDPTPPDPEVDPDPNDVNRLSPPTFSIGGGSYPLADYRLPLLIENPNGDIASMVFFNLDGGDWMHYTPGETITIDPQTEINAFVFSLEPVRYTSSTLASSTYRSSPVRLQLDLNSDRTSVSYYDLMENEVRVRWGVSNLEEIPSYLKPNNFFTTYWTDDTSDPAFGGRNFGESYSSEYEGEAMLLTPDRWDGNETLEISVYAESQDTTWVLHSEKPSVAITASKETLPSPRIILEELDEGIYRVTLEATDRMPPGAKIYYNAESESMSFDPATGHVAEGSVYNGPFIWEPEETQNGNDSGVGATGSVNIDRGNGDVPITQVVLRTNGANVTQNQSVAFDPMERPGADTMRGATVVDRTNSEITIESITINDNGNIIVADNVNVLDVSVSNLNYPDENLNQVTAYENGVKLGDANDSNFGSHLQAMLSSRDLRDYIKYDGNNNLLYGTPYDFDVTFSPLTNDDYLVVAERFGNSTFDLEALDASGNVISGSNKVVVREYSWNTGYAPSDVGGQPMFLAVIDIEKFGVNTDANSITGFRVNNDGGADCKFFTISDESFENRPVHFEGDLTAAVYPPADLTNWFSPSSVASTSVEGEIAPPEIENPIEATITFEKLTTSAGFLNEGYLIVNGVEHQFQTSDDPAGGLLDVAAIVGADMINTIDIVIYTTPRLNGQPTYERQMSYHSSLHGLHEVQPWESFNGAHPDRAKIKDTSYDGFTRLEFGFEDLIHRDPYGWLDNDYNDYNFEITMPDWLNFRIGGLTFEGTGEIPTSNTSGGSSSGGSSNNGNSNSNNGNSNSNNGNSNSNNGNSNSNNGNSNSNNGSSNSNNGNGNSSNGNGNSSNGNGNSNNGHGNNEDGVDVSNPGQGGGGPNGMEDPSGEVDDESGPGNGNGNNDDDDDDDGGSYPGNGSNDDDDDDDDGNSGKGKGKGKGKG